MAKKDAMEDFLTGDQPTKTLEVPSGTLPVKDLTPPPPKEKLAFKKREFKRDKLDTSGLGLSDELLPPLTRRRLAIYQLLSADVKFDHRVIEGPNRIEPAPSELHPIYEIYDPGEPVLAKRRKKMIYSNDIAVHEYYNTNALTVDTSVNKNIQMPEFVHGLVHIDVIKNYPKFVWWELHPGNINNKHRPSDATPKFKRIDIEFQSPHVQLMKRDLAMDAERHVIGLKLDQLINLAAAFGIPSTTKPSDMRLEMRRRAADNPKEVLFKSPDNTATAMMNVMTALDLGIIDFDPDSQNYYLSSDDKTPLWTCLVDQSPLEDFAKFLISPEGQDAKTEIESLLSFWH